MKLAVFSDLHIDHTSWRPTAFDEADLAIVAGDVCDDPGRALDWLGRQMTVPVVFVPGNHEFYGCEYNDALSMMKGRAEANNISLLDCGSLTLTIGDRRYRILGCTLWTDYEALTQFGISAENAGDVSMALTRDFREIRFGARMLEPRDVAALHRRERQWLERELAKPFDGATIVVTHYGPSLLSLNHHYGVTGLVPHFLSRMDELILAQGPDLWIHGHTHYSVDYRIGRTRIFANQVGKSPSAGRPASSGGFLENCELEL